MKLQGTPKQQINGVAHKLLCNSGGQPWSGIGQLSVHLAK